MLEVIALVLFAPAPPLPAPPKAADYFMASAVESFVYESTKREGEIYRFEKVLPPRIARWIRMLDNNDWETRREAVQLLIEYPDKTVIRRAVIWGTFPQVESAEIRERCNEVKLTLFICPECEGNGVCSFCHNTGWYTTPSGYFIMCTFGYETPIHKKYIITHSHCCGACKGSGIPVE